jgi:hypothetical protein
MSPLEFTHRVPKEDRFPIGALKDTAGLRRRNGVSQRLIRLRRRSAFG